MDEGSNPSSFNRIQHELNLAPGVWHARVKAKNTEGWSEYSDQATIVVQPGMFPLMLY